MTYSGKSFCLLGKIDLQVQGQPIGKLPGLLMGDILIIVGVGLAVLLSLMLVIRYSYYRKPKKKHRTDAQRVYRDGSPLEEEEDTEESPAEDPPESRRRYKYRWKRRDHRSRKPTLAETGGLPPPRPGKPTQSS